MHKHTNRLANETSPYLLQHAHNPVDWYAWGEEAFAKARAENKPIFLSIGYSACHWCHVMERESFESEATAELLNEHFVSIKVDREERPDVDSIYMQAVQMMTGHGGWPMSMFLTPEGVPFYGGTYFPPDDRHGLPSFPRVLEHVARAYRERPDEVLQVSGEMRSALTTENRAGAANEPLSEEMLHAVARRFVASFDAINGGFGGAPKFPPSMSLDFLMQVARRQRDMQLQEIVEMTLERMASGGIYDQVGGGFHRYSVDARWLVPHFEKMLYDNALLARAYVHAWQWTKSPFYERVARETLGFVQREMTSPDGGFYSTLDADSEGEEGKFYVWTRKEIIDVLGEDEGRKFSALYDVSERGNWEGHNILNLPRALETVAADLALTTAELVDIAQRGKCKLYGRREERVRPGRDEKILAGWNGWMLAAFSEAAMAFDSDDYRNVVRRNAELLIGTMMVDGRLHRSHKDGRTRIPALLEDYAGVAWGLLHAFEATQERRFLDTAAKLGDEIIDRFADAPGSGFFDTPHDHESLIARPKDLFDNATPAGNSVAAELFHKLALYFAEERYRSAAESAAAAAMSLAFQHPSAFGFLLGSLGYQLGKAIEIAITGSEAQSYAKAAGEHFLPHRIIVSSPQPDIPLMRNRPPSKDAAYVCRGYECLRPATSVEEFQAQLASVTRAGTA